MSALEMRYRRLLLAYPRDHRKLHEDEMLGVLLATATPGQRRPGVRDAIDLLRGALLVRVRGTGQSRSQRRAGDWWDALAIVSLLAPVLLSLGSVYEIAERVLPVALWSITSTDDVYQTSVWLGWPVAVVLLLLGMYRSAVVAAWVGVLWPTLFVGFPAAGEWNVLGVLGAVALTCSPPGRGLALVGRRRFATYVVGVVVVGLGMVNMRRPGILSAEEPVVADLMTWFLFGVGAALIIGAVVRFDTPAA